MTVVSSISKPAVLRKLAVEIFLSPVVQVELLLLQEISVSRKSNPKPQEGLPSQNELRTWQS